MLKTFKKTNLVFGIQRPPFARVLHVRREITNQSYRPENEVQFYEVLLRSVCSFIVFFAQENKSVFDAHTLEHCTSEKLALE